MAWRGNRLNAFHIQGYFICLLRQPVWHPEDVEIVDELMVNITRSHDEKAAEISRIMEAEYEYYINDDLPKAIRLLERAIEVSEHKHFAIKALIEIYHRRGFYDQEQAYQRMLGEIEDEE